jgi:hypothetical protein
MEKPKKYSDRFIDLKPDEINSLKKIDKKSKFEALKKVREMKKVLDTVDIYNIVISKPSLRYLDLVSKVRRFQIEAFKDLKEVKKALEDLDKKSAKSKGGRRGGGAGRKGGSKDMADKAIIDTKEKKDDSIQKLIKGIVGSKDMEDVRKAIQSYASLICQTGALKLYTNGSLGKVVGNIFTVLKQNLDNVVLKGHIGWDSSGWNASKELFDVMSVAFACLAQLKVVYEFVKGLFKRSFRVVTQPFRSGNPPPTGSGRGDGGDDDSRGPPPPPSSYDRAQRRTLSELLKNQQASIEAGISGASGGGGVGSGSSGTPPGSGTSGTPPGSGTSGTPPGSGTSGTPPGSGTQPGPGSGSATQPGSALTVTGSMGSPPPIIPEPFEPAFPPGYPIPPLDPSDLPDIPFFGGEATPNVNQFSGYGNPTANAEPSAWDPFNLLTGLAGMGTAYFTANAFNDYISSNLPPPAEASDVPPKVPGDDGLGFVDDDEPPTEPDESPEQDRKPSAEEKAVLDSLDGPESALATAGGLVTGGKMVASTAINVIQTAQIASKVFDQIAAAVQDTETIDQSVQLKDTISNQQVIQGSIQSDIISNMIDPSNVLQEELALSEDLFQDGLSIVDSMENGSMTISEGRELLQSITDYMSDMLAEIPKDLSESDDVSRIRTLRATIISNIEDTQKAEEAVGDEFAKEYEKLLKGYEDGLVLGDLQSEILPNIAASVAQQETISRDIKDDILKNMRDRAITKKKIAETEEEMRLIEREAQRTQPQPIVVSPTLRGLPFPLRPQSEGGALIPSREPSFANIGPSSRESVIDNIMRTLEENTQDVTPRLTVLSSLRERQEEDARARARARVDTTRLNRRSGRRFREMTGRIQSRREREETQEQYAALRRLATSYGIYSSPRRFQQATTPPAGRRGRPTQSFGLLFPGGDSATGVYQVEVALRQSIQRQYPSINAEAVWSQFMRETTVNRSLLNADGRKLSAEGKRRLIAIINEYINPSK